jgi:hypothetical protein
VKFELLNTVKLELLGTLKFELLKTVKFELFGTLKLESLKTVKFELLDILEIELITNKMKFDLATVNLNSQTQLHLSCLVPYT